MILPLVILAASCFVSNNLLLLLIFFYEIFGAVKKPKHCRSKTTLIANADRSENNSNAEEKKVAFQGKIPWNCWKNNLYDNVDYLL
jgi:hypothetical protein